MVLPTPKRSSSSLEKLHHYDMLVENGLSIDDLKDARRRIISIKTYTDTEWFKKNLLLQCINQIIEEEKKV